MSDLAEKLKAMSDEELDVLVAEKVMGFTWEECRCRRCGWIKTLSNKDGCTDGNCSRRPVPKRRADAVVKYSSDIAPAFEVVGRMHQLGFWLKLTSPFNAGDVWNAGFTGHDFTGWNG